MAELRMHLRPWPGFMVSRKNHRVVVEELTEIRVKHEEELLPPESEVVGDIYSATYGLSHHTWSCPAGSATINWRKLLLLYGDDHLQGYRASITVTLRR